MLSTQYRLRLEAICEKIVLHKEVSLEDMIWAEKLAKAKMKTLMCVLLKLVYLILSIWWIRTIINNLLSKLSKSV